MLRSPIATRDLRNGWRDRRGFPAVLLPYTVGGTDKAKDLFGLYEDTLSRLLAVAN